MELFPGSPSPSRIKVSAHIVGWMIFFFLPLLLSPGRDIGAYFSEPTTFLSLLIRNVALAALFYFNFFYLTPRYFRINNQLNFLLLISLLVLLIGSFNFFLHEWMTGDGLHLGRPEPPPPDRGGPPHVRPFGPPRRLMLASPYFSSVIIAALVAAASSLLVLWNSWMVAKANEQERNLQKVAAELSVLKLQISPHFLFNTLNNIRWLVRSKSDIAEPALVKLSQLLRYILYQTNHEFVSLDKELEHLQDYVSLEQMRLANPHGVSLNIEGDIANKSIVPLLLIPVVENFFKHGDFSTGTENAITISVTGNSFTMTTFNRILSTVKTLPQESGIGIENLKKRLSLHYPQKHTLDFKQENGNFSFRLSIELKPTTI